MGGSDGMVLRSGRSGVLRNRRGGGSKEWGFEKWQGGSKKWQGGSKKWQGGV